VVNLAENLARVQERMAAAAHRAGRDPQSVTLVAVTKTHPIEVIREALSLGATNIGENRVEEALPKIEALSAVEPAPVWHMIGHIQSRKAREVASCFDWAHSVDSAHLAQRLSRAAGEHGRTLPVFIECNVSGEASKSGLAADRVLDDPAQAEALRAEIEPMLALPHIQIRGLMTIAPLVEAPEQARPVFQQLRRLRDYLAGLYPQADWAGLSMGMTDDFEVAIEEGATCIRVGRAIFGERRQ
jgi:PLP dependent protein